MHRYSTILYATRSTWSRTLTSTFIAHAHGIESNQTAGRDWRGLEPCTSETNVGALSTL